MKEAFNEIALSTANWEKLSLVVQVLDDFAEQGYRLSLRQLYYQLVTKNIIPNVKSEYAKLGTLLVKGRMAGLVDWNAIEDRIRIPYIPYHADDVPDALGDLLGQYRLDRQAGQENYVEVWCEKDALSGILKKVTSYYHIRLMINRGYSSCTAMYEASKRFEDANSIERTILYLGDHDPSGLDMVRDIKDRLYGFDVSVNVRHIALTMKQINHYNPPPNPTKITDPRAMWYIQRFGQTCWEVDALPPDVLVSVLQTEIYDQIDISKFDKILKYEEVDKRKLEKVIEEWK